MKVNEVYQGDCRDLLRQLEDESIDCIITSPPYWSLRDYDAEASVWDGDPECEHQWDKKIKKINHGGQTGLGDPQNLMIKESLNKDIINNICLKCNAWKGQLGLEPTFDLYINHLCDIFDIIKEKLKKEGTCWVNLGDTYSGSGKGAGYNGKCKEQYIPKKRPEINEGLPEKCLCLIPERFAIEMTNRGWILRNVIIWQKPNCMPCSAKDRFTVDFEYVFFFVKNKKYFFNQQFEKSTTEFIYSRNSKKGDIQETNNPRNNWGITKEEYNSKYKETEYGQTLQGSIRNDSIKKERDLSRIEAKKLFPNDKKKQKEYIKYIHDHGHSNPLGRNKRTTWTIPTKPNPEAHFATFPPDLVKPMIKAGCPIQGIVLDPFAGVGTTCKTAFKLGRDFIGFDVSEKYIEIAKRLLKSTKNKRLTDFIYSEETIEEDIK